MPADTRRDNILWGILGTGTVAQDFARGLHFVPDAQLLAVGSRSAETARKFSQRFNVPKAYEGVDQLATDADVDVVYIATPNNRHKDDCLQCLEAGKAVLCEKPFALNAREAREIIALAHQRNLFCMEAMWMRFIPAFRRIDALLEAGTIGDTRLLMADFGVPASFDPKSRLFNPSLGGGSLLDRGVYALSLASLVFGPPAHISSSAHIGETGVDEQCAVLLRHAQGQLAILSATLVTQSSNEALICGSRGQVRIHNPFLRPVRLSVTRFSKPAPPSLKPKFPGPKEQLKSRLKEGRLTKLLHARLGSLLKRGTKTIVESFPGNGYNFEAAEVVRCLRANQTESSVMPLDETLRIMETMDTIRAQWGLRFPQE
jgi:predicted dehydrogenase